MGFIKEHYEKLIPLIVLAIGAFVSFNNFTARANIGDIIIALSYLFIAFVIYLVLKMFKR